MFLMSFFKKFLRLMFTVSTIFLISIILMEIVSRFSVLDEMLMFVKDVDHRMKPNKIKNINNDGIRYLYESDYLNSDDYNIIFLGDSFVYGLLLDYNDTIPAILEKKLRKHYNNQKINVINFGWVSSSPLLSYRLLVDIGKKYKSKMVILGIDMTDFSDDIKYEKLLHKKGIYKICDYFPASFVAIHKIIASLDIFSKLHEFIFGFPAKRFFVTEQKISDSEPYLENIKKNISSISKYSTNELNSSFVLTIFPRGYQYSVKESPNNWEKGSYTILGPHSLEPFDYLQKISKTANYHFYSLLPTFYNSKVFPTCFDNDPHYNKNGAEIAADGLLDYLTINRLISF